MKTPFQTVLVPAVGVTLLVALPFIANAVQMPALTSLATRALIFGIAAASLNLALGFGGMVSFGHAAFYGVGGYTVGILAQQYSAGDLWFGFIPGTNQFLLTLPLAALTGGLAAALVGAVSLRTAGAQFIMITLALAQMVFFLFVSLNRYGGDDGLMMRRPNSFPGFDLRSKLTFYYVCLVMAALVAFLLWRLVRSAFGVALAGIRQNERRMIAIGLPAGRYRLAAFVISGMGCGLAGALMTNFMRFASPDMLRWTTSGEFMVMVILGGAGTLTGPFAGAAIYVVLESVLASRTEYWQLPLGLILLAVVLFTRGGIEALARRLMGRTP